MNIIRKRRLQRLKRLRQQLFNNRKGIFRPPIGTVQTPKQRTQRVLGRIRHHGILFGGGQRGWAWEVFQKQRRSKYHGSEGRRARNLPIPRPNCFCACGHQITNNFFIRYYDFHIVVGACCISYFLVHEFTYPKKCPKPPSEYVNSKDGKILKIDQKVAMPLLDFSQGWQFRVENPTELLRSYKENLQKYDEYWISVKIQQNEKRKIKEEQAVQNQELRQRQVDQAFEYLMKF